MYPPSRARALAAQMSAERLITDLAEICLEEWLPLAEASALRAAIEPPPDPAAVSDQQDAWDYLVDVVLVYGVGLLFAHTLQRAVSALTGALPSIGDAATAVAWMPLQFDHDSLPSIVALRARVGKAWTRRFNRADDGAADVRVLDNRIARTPEIRQPVTTYLTGVRAAFRDVVGRAYRAVAEASGDRAAVREALAPEQWRAVAEEIGRVAATPALNSALTAAGQLAVAEGHQLEQEWAAILDTHTRPAHAAADGQRVPFGEMFTVGGEQLRFPADPQGSPDNTANCRCVMLVSVAGDLTAASPNATMGRDTEETTMGMYRSFTAVLAVIGVPTDDGRMFAEDIRLSFRDFPLPLLWQKQSDIGHFNSFTVGVIEGAHIEGTSVIGEGYMLDTPESGEAVTQAEHGVTGPSVDLGDVEWELRDENGKVLTEEDLWDLPLDAKLMQVVLSAKMLAATLVSTPAFGQTSITLGDMVERGTEAPALVAAAAQARFEVQTYPDDYFTDPGFDGPTLPHITESGRIQGHLAVWNVCHTGIQDRCVLAPHSATDYAWFHTSPPLKTEGGKMVPVGRLTVGGGHAAPGLSVGPAISHYDDVGTCFALVQVGEDDHGIWFSGVPAPGASSEQLAKGLSAPLSGDWRAVGGNLELVAALAVNTPGFPIIASGATDEYDRPTSLIAAIGPCPDTARQTPYGSDGLTPDQLKAFVRIVMDETRAADRRDARAREIIQKYNTRRAAALVARIDSGR